jgi:hypothetical protein
MKETYLYVILLPHMDKDYNLSYKVKFGFAKDFKSRMKNGYGAYYGDGYQVLHVYKGDFTQERDEFAIKQYLKEYRLFGTEWFKCCPEVLGFFTTYNTSKKLKAKISEIPTKEKKRIVFKVKNLYVKFVRKKVFSKLETDTIKIVEMEKNLEETLKLYTPENQLKYIIDTYSIDKQELLDYILNNKTEISEHVEVLVNEFFKTRNTEVRLKFIVDIIENKKLTEEEIDIFFDLIPDKYKDYYKHLGFSGIRAHRYNEAEIKREFEKLCGNSQKEDQLKEEIYRLFKVGNRYTKADIKTTLKNLYERLGYQKTAKATDLESYYNMKSILTPEKKHGFELLGKKGMA